MSTRLAQVAGLFLLAAFCLACRVEARAQPPASSAPLDTLFVQVHPVPRPGAGWERSLLQMRAVLLLHGFQLHWHREKANQALLRDWQKTGSKLVQALAQDADVYSFAYSQNQPVDTVAGAVRLRDGVRRLRQLGYEDIVLVGHSAGGLIARHLVEDHPHLGVTKVVQVCAPNGGSGYAKLDWLCKGQQGFLESLTKPARRLSLRLRADRRIPETVQFVSVIGTTVGAGDIVVSETAQWTKDLQEQGIPAVRLRTAHFWVTRNKDDARKLAELVRADHPRWNAVQVAAMKKKMLGN